MSIEAIVWLDYGLEIKRRILFLAKYIGFRFTKFLKCLIYVIKQKSFSKGFFLAIF